MVHSGRLNLITALLDVRTSEGTPTCFGPWLRPPPGDRRTKRAETQRDSFLVGFPRRTSQRPD